MRASPKRERSSIRSTLILFVLAAAIGVLAPRLMRGHAALQWTRHHVSLPADASGQNAREAARWASETLRAVAPLPWGARACRLALDFAATQEATNPAAALAAVERLQA